MYIYIVYFYKSITLKNGMGLCSDGGNINAFDSTRRAKLRTSNVLSRVQHLFHLGKHFLEAARVTLRVMNPSTHMAR